MGDLGRVSLQSSIKTLAMPEEGCNFASDAPAEPGTLARTVCAMSSSEAEISAARLGTMPISGKGHTLGWGLAMVASTRAIWWPGGGVSKKASPHWNLSYQRLCFLATNCAKQRYCASQALEQAPRQQEEVQLLVGHPHDAAALLPLPLRCSAAASMRMQSERSQPTGLSCALHADPQHATKGGNTATTACCALRAARRPCCRRCRPY